MDERLDLFIFFVHISSTHMHVCDRVMGMIEGGPAQQSGLVSGMLMKSYDLRKFSPVLCVSLSLLFLWHCYGVSSSLFRARSRSPALLFFLFESLSLRVLVRLSLSLFVRLSFSISSSHSLSCSFSVSPCVNIHICHV